MEKGDRDRDQQSHHQVGGIPLDWRYGNHQMDSFCPTNPWDQTPNSHMNFYEPNAPRPDVGWTPPAALMDMAAIASHFAMNNNNNNNNNSPPSSLDPYCNPTRPVSCQPQRNNNGVVVVGSIGEGLSDSLTVGDGRGMHDSGSLQGVGISGNESGNTNPAGGSQEDPSPKSLVAAKKRKMSAQEVGTHQVKEEGGNDAAKDGDGSKQKTEQEGTVKLNGKHGKEKVDPPKEDYIHVRARRGQATNSHSLAERVRREKISERMKLLQNLVPGCNKVTGKAVMLDEIINYVQSLQRQVEFLSMKLAAINPQLNFSIEGLLSKDILQSHTGPSSTTGLPPDMVHPLLHQNLQDLVQLGSFGMAAHPDALRRAVNAQMTSMTALKESKPQVPMAWDGEFHNGMQMNFVGSQPLNIQDLNAKSRDGFPM